MIKFKKNLKGLIIVYNIAENTIENNFSILMRLTVINSNLSIVYFITYVLILHFISLNLILLNITIDLFVGFM